ncbi:hypothetical protein [Raineya sp.]|jgi:PBP1b-binding outer membrane lipoprotein LpoB
MKKLTLIFAILIASLALYSCKKEAEEKKETKKDSTEQKGEVQLSEAEQKAIDKQLESVPQPPDYAKLIQGRWELKESNSFWAFYDKNKVYSDGNEEGTTYTIDLDKITYGSGGTAMILSLDEKEMVLQSNGTKQTWVKADLASSEQETPQIDPKKLIGLWDMEGGDDFSSIRFKANGNYDAVPFSDAYTYKVQGNKIYFKKTQNAPPAAEAEFEKEIVKLDAKELILKIDGKQVKYKRSKDK